MCWVCYKSDFRLASKLVKTINTFLPEQKLLSEQEPHKNVAHQMNCLDCDCIYIVEPRQKFIKCHHWRFAGNIFLIFDRFFTIDHYSQPYSWACSIEGKFDVCMWNSPVREQHNLHQQSLCAGFLAGYSQNLSCVTIMQTTWLDYMPCILKFTLQHTSYEYYEGEINFSILARLWWAQKRHVLMQTHVACAWW